MSSLFVKMSRFKLFLCCFILSLVQADAVFKEISPEICKCLSFGVVRSECLDNAINSTAFNFTEHHCYEKLKRQYAGHEFAHGCSTTFDLQSDSQFVNYVLGNCHADTISARSRLGWFSLRENENPVNCSKDSVFTMNFTDGFSTKLTKVEVTENDCPLNQVYKRLELYYDHELFWNIYNITGFPFTFSITLTPGKDMADNRCHVGAGSYERCKTEIRVFFYLGSTDDDDFGISIYAKQESSFHSLLKFSVASIEKLRFMGKIMDIFIPRNFSATVGFSGYGHYLMSYYLENYLVYPQSLRRPGYYHQPQPRAPENVTVTLQRLFPNSSFHFQLSWAPILWNTLPDKYRVSCKAFDGRDSFFHEWSCRKCYQSGMKFEMDCGRCMDFEEAIPLARYSGFHPVKITSSFAVDIPWHTYDADFTLRIASHLYDSHAKALWTYRLVPFSYHVMDLMKVNYSAFGTFSKAQREDVLRNLALASSQDGTMHHISQDDIQNLFLICRVRGIRADGVEGSWSKPVEIFVSDTLTPQSTFLATGEHYGELKYSLIEIGFDKTISRYRQDTVYSKTSSWLPLFGNHQMGSIFVSEQVPRMSPGLLDKRNSSIVTGCFHWLLSSWFAIKKQHGKYSLLLYRNAEKNMTLDEIFLRETPTNLNIDELVPSHLQCAHAHPFLIVSMEKRSSKKKTPLVNLFRLNLNSNTGYPESHLNRIPSHAVCKCGGSNVEISNSHVSTRYWNIQEFLEPEIIAFCGNQFCSYNCKTKESTTLVSWAAGSGNIKAFAADQWNMYVLLEAAMAIIPLESAAIFGNLNTVSSSRNATRIDMMDYGRNKLCSTETPLLNDLDTKDKIYPNLVCDASSMNNLLSVRSIDRILTHYGPLNLPVPPYDCIFPTMRLNSFDPKMVTNSSARIKLSIVWEKKCHHVTKPPTILQVRYAIFRDYYQPKGRCLVDFECQLKTSTANHLTDKEIEIGPLKFMEKYHFEVSVEPLLSDKVRTIWYSNVNPKVIVEKFLAKYQPPKHGISTGQLAGIVAAIITLGLILLLAIWYIYQKNYYLYKTLDRIFAKDVKMEKKLGEGHYGEVWKAKLYGKKTIVVKILKQSATYHEEKDFREEALLLSKLNSEYIVKAIGLCLQSRPIMLAMEFLNGGSLQSYLQNDDVRHSIGTSELFSIIIDAASGCLYLEENGYIHRDIAARNCLVQLMSDDNLKPKKVKLSDFGLARDVGPGAYASATPEDNALPVAWTAPESFAGKFSHKSDVWAFGVMIWEVFSWGSTPYGHCSLKKQSHQCHMEIKSYENIMNAVCVERKNLADLASPCNAQFSSSLRSIMEWCWLFEPNERPYFNQLVKFIEKSAKVSVFDESSPAKTSLISKDQQDYSESIPPLSTTIFDSTVYSMTMNVHDISSDNNKTADVQSNSTEEYKPLLVMKSAYKAPETIELTRN